MFDRVLNTPLVKRLVFFMILIILSGHSHLASFFFKLLFLRRFTTTEIIKKWVILFFALFWKKLFRAFLAFFYIKYLMLQEIFIEEVPCQEVNHGNASFKKYCTVSYFLNLTEPCHSVKLYNRHLWSEIFPHSCSCTSSLLFK